MGLKYALGLVFANALPFTQLKDLEYLDLFMINCLYILEWSKSLESLIKLAGILIIKME